MENISLHCSSDSSFSLFGTCQFLAEKFESSWAFLKLGDNNTIILAGLIKVWFSSLIHRIWLCNKSSFFFFFFAVLHFYFSGSDAD